MSDEKIGQIKPQYYKKKFLKTLSTIKVVNIAISKQRDESIIMFKKVVLFGHHDIS
jgi:hypothetical protein